ncbi:unnamed protein product [Toxocara canis]|uniref:Uncharacterized protein n=1 Tax=Toxocara canis TaxID=6265 RepID=A0A183UDP0_TOXCA|nr:unnamed protein product [Toxocara canis]
MGPFLKLSQANTNVGQVPQTNNNVGQLSPGMKSRSDSSESNAAITQHIHQVDEHRQWQNKTSATLPAYTRSQMQSDRADTASPRQSINTLTSIASPSSTATSVLHGQPIPTVALLKQQVIFRLL